ncbi:MAG: hypothetical protein M1834_006371 [Cirrosporium novae-zelandiae]|nr:MAG: hypothetical protein M1834_006371 [Cirrosporium novae-zelandiae]
MVATRKTTTALVEGGTTSSRLDTPKRSTTKTTKTNKVTKPKKSTITGPGRKLGTTPEPERTKTTTVSSSSRKEKPPSSKTKGEQSRSVHWKNAVEMAESLKSTEREKLDMNTFPVLVHKNLPDPKYDFRGKEAGSRYWSRQVFGVQETKTKSPLEQAQDEVKQWEKILIENKMYLPQAVPHVEKMLERAEGKLEEVKKDKKAKVKKSPSEVAKEAIDARLKVLHHAVKAVGNPEGRKNIKCAIEAYQSGEIEYSKQYTLIWAGKIVDRADTYGDFVRDRHERLDRYEKEYGAHWLWWEPPLDVQPEARPKAMRSLEIERTQAPNTFGLYYINLGFKRLEGWVTRFAVSNRDPRLQMETPAAVTAATRPSTTANTSLPSIPLSGSWTQEETDRLTALFGDNRQQVYVDGNGPRLTFTTLLDSGATFPFLNYEDMMALGIDIFMDCPQSYAEVETSNGLANRPLYELMVEVLDNYGNSLTGILPRHPGSGHYIGGVTPVYVPDTFAKKPLIPSELPYVTRLSGILPFLAPYITSVPAKNLLIMGEDRCDVTGLHRFPPCSRWVTGYPDAPEDRSSWLQYDNPKITFSHRNDDIRDEDIADGVTLYKMYPGTSREEIFYKIDTRQAWIDELNNSAVGNLNPDPTASMTG